MIGYRRGYSLQQVEDISLPSVSTFQGTPMYPNIANGSMYSFHFDRDGNFISLCDRFGKTVAGDGMKATELRYGTDFAVFEDDALVDVARLDFDYDSGIASFTEAINKSGTVSGVPNTNALKDSSSNFLEEGITVGMTIKNLSTLVTGIVIAVGVTSMITNISWTVDNEYQITGTKKIPPDKGRILTCNYYRRVKDITSPYYYADDTIFKSYLPSVYTVGIIPSRKLGLTFTNI